MNLREMGRTFTIKVFKSFVGDSCNIKLGMIDKYCYIMCKFSGGALSSASIEKVVFGCAHVGIHSHGHNLDTAAYYHGTFVNRDVSGNFRDHWIPTSGIFKLDFDLTLWEALEVVIDV